MAKIVEVGELFFKKSQTVNPILELEKEVETNLGRLILKESHGIWSHYKTKQRFQIVINGLFVVLKPMGKYQNLWDGGIQRSHQSITLLQAQDTRLRIWTKFTAKMGQETRKTHKQGLLNQVSQRIPDFEYNLKS